MALKKRTCLTSLVVMSFVFLACSPASGQTDGTATFTVTTARNNQAYDPSHVLAIWVTDNSNNFVKTLKRRAASRERYLYEWLDDSDGNDVDAVTGATLNSHQAHTVTWDCRNASGTLMPDGQYRMHAEFTTRNGSGPVTPDSYLPFTKGEDDADLTFADLQYFKDMTLSYQVDREVNTWVARESQWRYNDTGLDLHGSGWADQDHDDSAWATGAGKLGYSDDAVTELDYGPDANNKHPCYYFRHTFQAPYVPKTLRVGVLRDDGVVVYLNGTEVARDNMPGGNIFYSDLAESATGSSDEDTYFQFYIDASLIKAGENVIAAEVHQSSLSSSDLGFDLELKAGEPADIFVVEFMRGDVNNDTNLDLADAITILTYLFADGPDLTCFSTADTNDDGSIDLSDAVFLLTNLFGDVDELPAPFEVCGQDETPDELTCEAYSPCGQ